MLGACHPYTAEHPVSLIFAMISGMLKLMGVNIAQVPFIGFFPLGSRFRRQLWGRCNIRR